MQPHAHHPVRSTTRLLRIPVLLSTLVLVIGSCGQASHAASTADEADVRAATTQFCAALNAGVFGSDLGPMKEIWSHATDVTYMGPFGGLKVGWDQVLAEWETQSAKKITGEIKAENIHVTVGRDLAVTQCFEKGKNTGADGKTVDVTIRATNIFRKEGGKWRMISHHTDLIPDLGK